jgi:ATP-binding protein involved in chromosome partitioning
MAGFRNADGTVIELFGAGGGAEVARRLSTDAEPVPLLASVPLSLALREGGDRGIPIVLAAPNDPAAIAIEAVASMLATRNRDLSRRRLPISPT